MLNWPARLPYSLSRRLAGGARKSCKDAATIEHTQLPQGNLLDIRWKLSGPFTIEYFLSLFRLERFDHEAIL